MAREYDIIIIGTGVAGTVCANKAAAAGMKIAITDIREYGGTCALRGCIPKKVLVGVAETVEQVNRFNKLGIMPQSSVDWSKLMEFKQTFVENFPANKEEKFKNMDIETYHGGAKFVSQNEVKIADTVLKGKHILIAPGSVPRKIGIKGEENLITSEQFLNLDELPRRIVFVGGGYISFELAHVAARAGSQVTILQRSEVLKQFDREMVKLLVKASKEAGININTGVSVSSVESTSSEYTVNTKDREDKESHIECDLVVNGSGRIAALEGMELERGNVDTKDGFVETNEYMQSVSNPYVYAAGDCVKPGAPLTPVASLQGTTAADNMIKGNVKTVDYTGIPSTVFTLPPLSSVGVSLSESTDRYEVLIHDRSHWYNSRRLSENYAASKVIIEKESQTIAGAHLLGSHSEEVINLFAMAVRLRLTLSQFKRVVYVFPTASSEVQFMIRE
jgi:glutathione reductase (NADPH)